MLGALLWARRRVSGPEAQLERVEVPAARLAGRATLGVCAVSAGLVAVIFGARLRSGGSFGPLSLGMPLVSLVWVASLGRKAFRHRELAVELPPAASERPSRRPPSWDAGPSSKPSQSGGSSNRHVSA